MTSYNNDHELKRALIAEMKEHINLMPTELVAIKGRNDNNKCICAINPNLIESLVITADGDLKIYMAGQDELDYIVNRSEALIILRKLGQYRLADEYQSIFGAIPEKEEVPN